ncbi:MAG: efflux transporter outer membrane subunit [Steroidobacteraceae bacterium]
MGLRLCRTRLAVALCGAALVCASCATAPAEPAAPRMPAAYEQALPDGEWPRPDWYQGFGNAELAALIVRATSANLDLAAAQARVLQANARARLAGAALLPGIDANGTVTDTHGRAGSASLHETDWSALVSASYEIDFWGANRQASRSAKLLAAAGQAEQGVIRLTTVASVATTYFELLSARERLAVAQSNVDNARQVLRAVEARYGAGLSSPFELATQRAAQASAELAVEPLRQSELELRAALAVLVGETPEDFQVAGVNLDGLSEPVISAGLPSELLRRRPDLRAAEWSLQAAHADLQAARAAFFPRITLTSNGGVQNPAVQAAVNTLAGTGSAVVLGASVVQGIFDGGRRRATRDAAAAREQELLATYRGIVLGALRDVEVSLSSVARLQAQTDAQQQNLQQSSLAFQGAQMRYQAGYGDYLAMLEAQRTLCAARDQRSQFRLAQLKALVGVFKALGGGWTDEPLQ